jgi:hypothetical protein
MNAMEAEHWLRAERDLWKERTKQGSLIIEGNVAEIERLKATVEQWVDINAAAGKAITEAKAENERLKALVAQYKKWLSEALES